MRLRGARPYQPVVSGPGLAAMPSCPTHAEGGLMNLDLLTIKRFTAGLVYPPVAYARNDLTYLFEILSDKYDYSTLSLMPDGARISHGDNEVVIQPVRTQINETISAHFQHTKDRAVQMLELVARQFNIHTYQVFGVKLIAFQPANGSAAEFLESRLLSASPSQLAILGQGRRGTGFRFNLFRDNANYDLRLEPFFNDLSQLYIELDVNYQPPMASLAEMGPRIDKVYSYLLDEVREFLASLG